MCLGTGRGALRSSGHSKERRRHAETTIPNFEPGVTFVRSAFLHIRSGAHAGQHAVLG